MRSSEGTLATSNRTADLVDEGKFHAEVAVLTIGQAAGQAAARLVERRDGGCLPFGELDAAARRLAVRMLGAANGVGFKRYFRRERRGLRNWTPSPVPSSSMNFNAACA